MNVNKRNNLSLVKIFKFCSKENRLILPAMIIALKCPFSPSQKQRKKEKTSFYCSYYFCL